MFDTRNADEQLFVGVVSDSQWAEFCKAFELDDLSADASLALNNERVLARDRILPRIREMFAAMTRDELIAKLEGIGLPFAPITRPDELFDDPHLNAGGGLVEVNIPGGEATRLPALPLEIDGERMALRRDVPAIDADRESVLRDFGLA